MAPQRDPTADGAGADAALLRRLLEHLPHTSLTVFDTELRVRLVTGKGIGGAEVLAEALEGHRLDEIVPEPQAGTLAALYREALRGRTVSRGYRSTVDGRFYWLSVVPLHDESGEVEGGMAVSMDITDRIRAERSLRLTQERFRSAFEQAPIGMALIRSDGHFLRVNSALSAMLGREEAELLTLDVQTLTHPDDLKLGEPAVRRLLQGETSAEVVEKRYIHRDGSIVRARVSVSLVHDEQGRPLHFVTQIENITERVQREVEEAVLRHVAELVASGRSSGALYAAVARGVRDAFECSSGLLARHDPRSGVTIRAGESCDVDGDPSTSGADRCVTEAIAAVLADGRPATAQPSAGAGGAVAAPIVVKGHLWGALVAVHEGRVPTGAQERLERFAVSVSMAIGNAHAWEAMAREAATDPVTGLANHRTFYDRLQSEVQRARRYDRDLSLILLDLDHFKAINDTFGHQAGDGVLAEIAARLAAAAREGELVARVGGEEFAWLMPETDGQGAYRAAERLRRQIDGTPCQGVGRVTASFGVCGSHRGLDAEDLVRYADRALYWAKDGGRNATFLYTEEAHAVLSEGIRLPERYAAMASVRALARAIDSKDPTTCEHSERVADVAERLALELGWTAKRARMLHACGLLHDVGKIGIPDRILLKPGSLDEEEYATVKRHAELSAIIASEVFEDEQVNWIRGHHERWDGTGYPDRLAGEQIPDGAQLLALADAYDVMTQSRTYKLPKSLGEALGDCQEQAGRQFAPAAVAALLRVTTAATTAAAA